MPAWTSHALESVAPHCDLVDRLRFVPPSACVRGLFFQTIEAQVELLGKASAYRAYFPDDVYGSLPYYPLSDFLIRLACAGSLVSSRAHEEPGRPGTGLLPLHAGMRVISRSNMSTFVQSLLGGSLVRVLSRDPLRLTEQWLAARRQTHRYGRWTLQRISSAHLQVVHDEEFLWIESAIRGSAEGAYAACLPEVQLETEQTGRFTGKTSIRW